LAALGGVYRRTADGVSLTLRVTPKARRAAIDGLRDTADGAALAVAVNAPPEDGKANAAVIALIAEALDLPKSAVSLAQGGKSRHKTLHISGSADDLAAKLDALISGESPHG
jgi:uncharacterized protein (TIGR00251 family)